ncbi:MAG: glycosyltransferase family 9 protein [Bacteroidales bacterium]|jgi:ADP-heptose:LPS heptosyltransferase|nr:glycosyltransferase family 9 protein [Bacteroidales bacterium]
MNILVIRFSAIGDVAMTVPVIDSVARNYPETNFTVVSREFMSPLFDYMPDNVTFIPAYLKSEHGGIAGIFRLFWQLKQQNVDVVADLHDVLRTKLLRLLFRLWGASTVCIHKGRQEKRKLTRRKNKDLHQLKTSFARYQDVFTKLNLPAETNFISLFPHKAKSDYTRICHFTGEKNGKWIGIAPFAKHAGKIYPAELTEKIVAHFSKQKDITLFLFGNGKKEKEMLEAWELKYANTKLVAGKLSGLGDELILMDNLNVMLSMDSANMHLASLVLTPVVSIWGATHPFVGFYGWRQLQENALQLNLSCRPCSVYGNKLCYRRDYACFSQLNYNLIIKKIEEKIIND